MKFYCLTCQKVQPVIIDNDFDTKTNEPYQDIVCKECHFVVAGGTDIQREWVGLTDEEFDFLVPYCQNEFDLNDYKEFARDIEAKLKEKNT